MKVKNLIALFLLLTCLFTTKTKAQTEGDIFFSQAMVHDVYMTFTQTNYWDSLVAYKPLDLYLRGDVTIDGVLYPNVGIKFKGNSSYSNPSNKKPFKIDLNEYVAGQDIDGIKKFNLNNGFKDPSFMREKVALDFYNQQGLAAPRCSYARVYLNGTYWGLYMFVEEANKTFLDDRFGNKQGNMFKGDPMGDLKWINSTPSSYYTKYELHTNETVNDWTDLVNLIDNINNSGTNFYDSLEVALNTSTFIRHWAAMNLFVNLDSYIGSGHNYFIYHDTLSNKFEWVSWDANESFGNFNMGLTNTQLKNLTMYHVSAPSSSRPLVQKMLTVPSYKSTLTDVFCQWLQYDFSNAALDSKIDSLANAIRTDVYADGIKFYSNADFETNLTSDVGMTMGIKTFITDRRNALITELFANGCLVGVNENTTSNNQINVYPNPANDFVTIDFNSNQNENLIYIYNSLGQEMSRLNSSTTIEKVDISKFPAGMYLIKINANSYLKFQKIN